jgi:hypothetical protein
VAVHGRIGDMAVHAVTHARELQAGPTTTWELGYARAGEEGQVLLPLGGLGNDRMNAGPR